MAKPLAADQSIPSARVVTRSAKKKALSTQPSAARVPETISQVAPQVKRSKKVRFSEPVGVKKRHKAQASTKSSQPSRYLRTRQAMVEAKRVVGTTSESGRDMSLDAQSGGRGAEKDDVAGTHQSHQYALPIS